MNKLIGAVALSFLGAAIAEAPARADAAADCLKWASTQKETPPRKLQDLGCFEKIKASDDGEHAYGHVVCLFVADGTCSGLLYHYDANIEPDWAVFERASCGGKDHIVSFSVVRKFKTTFADAGPVEYKLSFSGKVEKGALQGTLTEGSAKGATTRLKRRKGGLKVGEQWARRRQLEQTAACLAARAAP